MANIELDYQQFREPQIIKALAQKIRQRAPLLPHPLSVMEVCGGHTHAIMKYGLKQLLPANLTFVHGPGCPVCVMPKERIDQAIMLAQMPDVILVCLGDMIRVPGSHLSLAQCRAQGGHVEPVYDPQDALTIAREHRDKKVVFFAIGFETTTPMTAVLVLQAEQQKVNNLYFHINHVIVPPAMDAVLADGSSPVNAFIGPSHVAAITGAKIFTPLIKKYHVPVVVAGFEPVDILQSVLMLIEQCIAGTARLEIQYRRVVTVEGNSAAQKIIHQVFTTRPEFNWRGLGNIAASALQLRAGYAHRDIEVLLGDKLPQQPIADHKICRCGDILRGLATPPQCKVFGRGCNPAHPLGSCMVSSEGACNAYYRYAGIDITQESESCL